MSALLSEVQEKRFEQVGALKWKGRSSNPFESLLLGRFAKILQHSPPDLIYFYFVMWKRSVYPPASEPINHFALQV